MVKMCFGSVVNQFEEKDRDWRENPDQALSLTFARKKRDNDRDSDRMSPSICLVRDHITRTTDKLIGKC